MNYKTVFNNETKIWRGNSVPPLYNTNQSIGQAILWALKRNERKIGQISANNGISLTNEEIRLKTIRAAQNLLKIGYRDGDIIGIIARNSHHLAPIVFAALSIGCPITTLDTSWTTQEIVHIFGKIKPKVVFCDEENVRTVKDSMDHLVLKAKLFTFGNETKLSRSVDDLFVTTKKEDEFIPLYIHQGANKLAMIMCSSGTTGPSKGVCLSHAGLLDRISNMVELTVDDIAFSYSSLYWISGLLTLLSATLHGSTRVITTKTFAPVDLIANVAKHQITFIMGPPSHLYLTLKSNLLQSISLTSLRYYLCGGSMMSQDLCNKLERYLPNGRIHVAYGLTEASGCTSINYPQIKPSSVGCLTNEVQAKIINDMGEQCGVDENGELYLKLNYPFMGYYGDDETTADTIDKNGWLKTGDIAHFDADGYLYIVDRKKDILKYCNCPLSPSEIEDTLIRNPAIKQVCVVGVPDLICTDLPAAVVVKQESANITESEIYDIVKNQFNDFKQLRGGVYFVDTLPMTPSGKVIRRLVKETATKLYRSNETTIEK